MSVTALVECAFCNGEGRIHSPGKNGDPWDNGVPCPKCEGNGCVEVDVEENAP